VVQNVVSNVTYASTSSVATLTVIADTNPPVLVAAQPLSLTQLQVSFSERISPLNATNAANYHLSNSNGAVEVLGAVLDPSQTNVLLTITGLADGGLYTLIVTNLTDQSHAANVIAPNSQVQFVASTYALVGIGNTSSGNQVVLTFAAPAQPYFYYVAGQTPIVAQHVWTTGDPAKDPVQFQDANPIGTGPFKVNPCNPNLITYTANKSYWQQGLPHLDKILYPAYIDNNPANLDLANDKAQWGSQYIPGVDKFYTSKDSANHHTWFPPVVNVELFFNLKHDATGKLAVRQAFAYGIDRDAVSTVGEGGLQKAANQSGIVLPTYKDWYDQSTASQFTFDKAKATAALATAGYSPANPLKLNVITIEGYTDWDASLAEIKQQLAPLGIDLSINDLAQTTYNDQLYKGDFDVAYGSETGGPAPYYELRQILYGANSAPLGQNAATNYERYTDPATDALFDQYASADSATQHTIINKLQQVMLSVVPVVPTTESVDWYEYNTQHITGWPTPDDPYAQPAAYNVPDWGIVAAHLESK
jgi:peptide/nickel transport system substrate-binding protein